MTCPKCGSRNLRISRTRTPKERLALLIGIQPVRCRDCRTRFTFHNWQVSTWCYAKCPRCYQMDLSTWTLHHYRVPGWKTLLINLGANPYRCEYCRHNFVSLRRRKYKFSFRRRKTEAAPVAETSQENESGSK